MHFSLKKYRQISKAFRRLLLIFAAVMLVEVGYAATYTSVGNGGVWDDPNTWNQGSVPGVGDDVVVDWGDNVYSTNVLNIDIESLTINGDLSLIGTLNVDGDLYLHNNHTFNLDGDLYVGDDLENNGTFIVLGNLNVEDEIYHHYGNLFVVGGDLTSDGDIESNGNFVVAGNFNSTGGSTIINDYNGGFYVIGVNDCTDSDCDEILNVGDWLTQTPPPGEAYIETEGEVFTTSGFFTVPAGVTQITVQAWGGGGAGGAATSNNNQCGGGGGGASATSIINVEQGQEYTITVGLGGSSASGGEDSEVERDGTTYILAKGGAGVTNDNINGAAGGVSSACIGNVSVFSGGNGSSGGGGNPRYGGGGGSSAGSSANGNIANGRIGGSAPSGGGDGGDGGRNANGLPGIFPGGGGGGAESQSSGALSGGGGANGQIIITWEKEPGTGLKYYRTQTPGDWSATSTWESSDDGSTWQNATSTPTSADYSILVRSGHTVNVDSDVAADELTVESGGEIIIDNSVTFTIDDGSGTDLTLNGDLTNQGILIQNGTIEINSGATYTHEKNGGNIPTAAWDAASNCIITGMTDDDPGNTNQTFGNFTWNCTSQTGNLVNSGDITVQGDFSLQNGTFTLANGIIRTLTILGNYNQTGGIFDSNSGTINQGIINVEGNFTNSAGQGTFTTNGAGSDNAEINFNGSSLQMINLSDPNSIIWASINVSSGSHLQLQSDITLTGHDSETKYYADLYVFGTIDFGTYTIDDDAYNNVSDASHFELDAGATLITANTQGINSTNYSGSVQFDGFRTYSTDANYTYNGTSAQVTGDGFTGADILTIDNSSGVTLTESADVESLVFNSGILTTTQTELLSITGTDHSNISGYGNTSYVSGPLRRTFVSNTNETYIFPIGDGGYNPFELVDFNSTGTMVLQAEVIDADCGGTTGSGITTLNTNRYWQISVVLGGGNFTNTKIRLTESSSLPSNAVMGFSSTLAGSYNAISTSPPIGATILSDNHLQQGYFVIGQASTDPILNVVPSSIDFGYVASDNTDTQTFTLTGSNLDGDDVIITGSSDFQVSTDGSTFSNSVTISSYGTSISQNIYVQFAPSAANTNYSDNIVVSGGGADDDGVVAVSGNSNITYCNASGNCNPTRYISRVRFGAIDVSSGCDGYSDFTANSNDLMKGYNEDITIDFTNLNGNYEVSVWVDWDQDGTFNSTDEREVYCQNVGTGNQTRTYTINMPTSALAGSTRMRIRLSYNFCDPCGAEYAEVEDYTINVIPAVSITTSSLSASSYCPGSEITVPYTTTGTFNVGNEFSVQLSDDGFATYTDLTTANSSSGEITAILPLSVSDGDSYRVRVVSSSPAVTGTDNGSDIFIGSIELITSPGSQCKYGNNVTVTVSASSSQSGTFIWYADASGSTVLYTSASNVTYSEYTVTINTNQTYYVALESGGCSSSLTPVTAHAIIPPTLSAAAGGTFCEGSTVYLYSDGSGYDNIYWEGPNSFFSTDEDPVINNATTDMSGTYTVHTNSLSGINLVTNGDFEAGNTDFSSSYSYVAPTTNALWPEGLYTIVDDPNAVHNNFISCGDHSSGSGNQMVINGATTAGVSIWSQTVNVVPNTYYQFTYWIQSVVGNNPSELQLYINGTNAGPIYTANATTCDWNQFLYNWDSGSETTAVLSLVNQNTVAGGNDFALDDIVFQHTCTAEASVEVSVGSGFVPDVTITADPGETICDGDLISFTATPINGGTSPSYQWYQNGTPVTNEINSTFTPATINDLDEIYCEMTTSLSCISGSATVDSDVLTITVIEPPTAIAGGNLFSCGISPVEITSGASATNYSSIEWTSTGSGVFSDAASLTACTYTPSATDITTGSVTITLTASGNSPCGDEIDTKTLTFTDPIDVKADYLFTDYCPQFLPPVSFNNDDDPRPPGRTELNFVLVPLNASANWQFELDFNIVATPGVSGTLSIDDLAVIENGTEITATGGVYTADASTDTIFINALIVNQPGHSLDVIIDAINVTSAGCTENEEDNNTSTITIYPMPAIGKFE